MRPIKVRLHAEFKDPYSNQVKKGKKVFIDRIQGIGDCRTHLMVRVANIWKRPQWFDSGWFKFKE